VCGAYIVCGAYVDDAVIRLEIKAFFNETGQRGRIAANIKVDAKESRRRYPCIHPDRDEP